MLIFFNGMDPDRVYYSDFGDIDDADDNVLLYCEDIFDQKEIKVNKNCIEALDNYIGAKVVVTGKYYIPVIARVKLRKRDTSVNLINKKHSNPILEKRVYEFELSDGRVDEYVFKIIIDNIIDQIYDHRWDTGVLEEIVAFRCYHDVAITTGEQAYKNAQFRGQQSR